MRTHHLAAIALCLGLGTVPASANLFTNGDFSAGDTGFTTDYRPFVATNGTVHTNPPAGALITNPSVNFTNGYYNYTDHTGDAAGLMLFIDGQTGSTVWSETVSLDADTTYIFTYWAATADDIAPPNLQVLLNGLSIGNDQVGSAAGWTKFTKSFTTGAAGDITLSLTDLVPDVNGNDFTVDDFDLEVAPPTSTGAPEPLTLSLFGAGLGGLAAMRKRKAKHTR